MNSFCVAVSISVVVGLIDTYTLPYDGGTLSSPPHTLTASASGYSLKIIAL